MVFEVQVFYVRHGESTWNAEKESKQLLGMTPAQLRTLGAELRFTDAPLSAQGIRQATQLSERLFEDLPAENSLAKAMQCAQSGNCEQPLLYTSNVRRAMDTLLLALRPLISNDVRPRVLAVPALQESCIETDCTPLPLGADGSIRGPRDDEDSFDGSDHSVVRAVLRKHREQLMLEGADLLDYITEV